MNMLMDVLGIVFAFASVMLFFSLLVTMVVHAIQATFNVRYYNLKHGIDVFMQHTASVCTEVNEKLTLKILATPFENGSILKIKRTSISQEELLKKIKKLVPCEEDAAKATQYIEEQFSQFENFLSERYTRITHMISFISALLVVMVFQIHAFDLLNGISKDAELRARLSHYGEQAISDTEIKDSFKKNETALDTSGDLASKQREAINQLDAQLDKSSLFDFQVLPKHKEYFYQGEGESCLQKILSLFKRYLGLAASAILISLGAPFWFNTLQSVASLKDKLAEYKK